MIEAMTLLVIWYYIMHDIQEYCGFGADFAALFLFCNQWVSLPGSLLRWPLSVQYSFTGLHSSIPGFAD